MTFAVGTGRGEFGNPNKTGMKRNENRGKGASSIAPGTDRLITKREAAERLGVSVRTVERLVVVETLQIQKLGGCVRLRLSQVLRAAGIESETIPPLS